MIGVSLIVKDGIDWVKCMHADLIRSDFSSFSHKLVAVDNGSTDGTAEWLEVNGWTIIRNPINIGIVAARNQTFWMLAALGCDFTLEVHADMRFPSHWFTPLVASMGDPDVYMSCPRIVTRWDRDLDIGSAEDHVIEDLCRQKRDGFIPDNIWTANFNHPCLHRMKPFMARGFYDDRFKWQEFEDTDLYYDYKFVQKKKVAVVKGSAVYHYCAGQRLNICTTEHAKENEAYFKRKWSLPDHYFNDLWGVKSNPVVILSGCEIDNSGGGQTPTRIALELLKMNHSVVFVQNQESVIPYIHPRLRVVTYKEFCGQGLWDAPIDSDRLDANVKNWQGNNGYGHEGGLALALNPLGVVVDIAASMVGSYWKCRYWVLDDWQAFRDTGDAPWYDRETEDRLIGISEAVFAVSKPLADQVACRHSRGVTVIPNGYDPSLFNESVAPFDLGQEGIHIGYWGSLWGQWFDWALVAFLAMSRPEWTFHFIGSLQYVPNDILIKHVAALPNVVFHGEKQGAALAGYGAVFDLGIIPFKDNKVTWAVSPIKAYEYLACGLRVVSRPMADLLEVPGAHLAYGYDDFLASMEEALSLPKSPEQDQWLVGQTWAARAVKALSPLDAL